MPRKLPSSYLRKLNEERKRLSSKVTEAPPKRTRREEVTQGKLKSFTMICQTCGARSQFTVSTLGYATCGNCHARAAYRIGNA